MILKKLYRNNETQEKYLGKIKVVIITASKLYGQNMLMRI